VVLWIFFENSKFIFLRDLSLNDDRFKNLNNLLNWQEFHYLGMLSLFSFWQLRLLQLWYLAAIYLSLLRVLFVAGCFSMTKMKVLLKVSDQFQYQSITVVMSLWSYWFFLVSFSLLQVCYRFSSDWICDIASPVFLFWVSFSITSSCCMHSGLPSDYVLFLPHCYCFFSFSCAKRSEVSHWS
jgi:hypothetical protein